jgi:hypothetical protein
VNNPRGDIVMAVRKKVAAKPKAAPRTKPRVEKIDSKRRAVTKSAQHRQTEPALAAMAKDLGNGEVLITAQLSELVPVADFASVTLGPNQLAWKFSGVDMSILADVDWDNDEPLTPKQQMVYDRIRGALKATGVILEHALSEDRETVERGVRQHSEREASETKKTTRRRRS